MSEELFRRVVVVVVVVVAIEMVASVRSRLALLSFAAGNECQAPSEFSLIVGICRKLKYDVRQQPR